MPGTILATWQAENAKVEHTVMTEGKNCPGWHQTNPTSLNMYLLLTSLQLDLILMAVKDLVERLTTLYVLSRNYTDSFIGCI